MDTYLSQTSESPARTDSTTESVETILIRKSQSTQHILNSQTTTMANSTNTTNNCSKNSLTNSQISMISNDQKDSHIYTSPDLVCPKMSTPTNHITVSSPDKTDQQKTTKPSLPEPEQSIKSSLKKKSFPIYVILGLIQLILSLTLAALGGLLIVRGASLASSASGMWASGLCAIAGALGVINLRKVQTGFLAVSLICVASSTLAMALTGIGLVRDINRLEMAEFNKQTTKAAISAGSGLIFALILHFLVSIISVYQSALRLCSKYNTAHKNASMISQQKVEEYIKSMSGSTDTQNEKTISPEYYEKLKTMWMYSAQRGMRQMKTRHIPLTPPVRPIMLVPASSGNGFSSVLPPGYRLTPPLLSPPVLYPPSVYSSGCVLLPRSGYHHYPTVPLPSLPLGSAIHPESLYKIHSTRTGSVISKRQLKRRNGTLEPHQRQRRKSDSDIENRKAFTYTGLDRAIADSFLERQEQSQVGNDSHFDYSSSSESGRDVCPDVAI